MSYCPSWRFWKVCIVCALAGCSTDNLEPNTPASGGNPQVPLQSLATSSDTLIASADALLRSAAKNGNSGTSSTIPVKVLIDDDDPEATLAIVKFDQASITAAAGSGVLTTATLEFAVKESGTGSGGNDIAVRRVLKPWTEAGVTWKCGEDLNTSNVAADCPTTGWKIGANLDAFALTRTARTHLSPGQTGIVRFDVTGDVQAFLAGTSNHGWVLHAATASSRAVLWSREAALKPRLVLSVTRAAAATRRLITVVEAGVTGSPATRDTLYTSGATVAYSFSAGPGYHDVLVTLDGQTVPPSGSVVMDTVHFLRASALLNVELPAGGEPLLQSARAILTSSDPVAAFQAHLDQVLDSYQALGEAEATRRLEAIYFLAFDPIQDSAAFRRVDEALAGHVFQVYPRQGSAHLISPLSAASSGTDVSEPTVYAYVNGISTNEPETALTMGRLLSLVQEASLLGPGSSVQYFYNRTSVDQPQVMTPEGKAADCLHKLGPGSGFGGEDDLYQRLFMLCLAQPLPGEPDILEAIRQYKRVYLGSGKFEADADSLARRIQEWRNAGSHVVVVPHSEGNMMLQQAVTALQNSGEFNTQRDSSCIGAMSLAAPTDQNWPLDIHHLKHVIVRGDMIPDLGGILIGFGPNGWERLDTPLSQQMDREVALMGMALPYTLVNYTLLKLKWGSRLHSVDSSYFGQAAPRQAIAEGLGTLFKECSIGSVEGAFPGETVFPGFTRPLKLYVIVMNQNGRPLKGRRLTWSSSDAAVASVDTEGNLMTHSPGTAVITGKSGERTATFTYTVQPVPDYGISGTWQGTWTRRDFGSPPEGGSLAVTLAQSGSSVTGSVTHTYRDTTYTRPILNGAVSADFDGRVLVRFEIETPEESGCCWSWQVSLGFDGPGRLAGGASGWKDGRPTGGSRGWILSRPGS